MRTPSVLHARASGAKGFCFWCKRAAGVKRLVVYIKVIFVQRAFGVKGGWCKMSLVQKLCKMLLV